MNRRRIFQTLVAAPLAAMALLGLRKKPRLTKRGAPGWMSDVDHALRGPLGELDVRVGEVVHFHNILGHTGLVVGICWLVNETVPSDEDISRNRKPRKKFHFRPAGYNCPQQQPWICYGDVVGVVVGHVMPWTDNPTVRIDWKPGSTRLH